MASVNNYSELEVWKRANDLVVEIYRLTKLLPYDERYGLVQQLRRAAISVSSNIAEGQARRTTRDFVRFLVIALGSLAELESQLHVAHRLGLLRAPELAPVMPLITRTGQLLRGLERKLSSSA